MADDIRDTCARHGEQIARLEIRMDNIQTEISAKLSAILANTEKTNGRLGRLERWRAWLTGGVAFAVAGLGAAATVLGFLR